MGARGEYGAVAALGFTDSGAPGVDSPQQKNFAA
jgi:hypothetical protein